MNILTDKNMLAVWTMRTVSNMPAVPPMRNLRTMRTTCLRCVAERVAGRFVDQAADRVVERVAGRFVDQAADRVVDRVLYIRIPAGRVNSQIGAFFARGK